MPTVIDALVVTLGLDASEFNAQQKKAVGYLRDLQERSRSEHAQVAIAQTDQRLDTDGHAVGHARLGLVVDLDAIFVERPIDLLGRQRGALQTAAILPGLAEAPL